MNENTYCVIMAGGLGTRFWPISRSDYPKQFIDILGTGESLLQQTYSRFAQIVPEENIFIVTNEKYKQLVHDQLPDLYNNQIVPEPARRNTAPCLAYACYKIHDINPDANIIVTPSDHIITKENNFLATIQEALDVTEVKEWILTLGIPPNWPETEYGYIQYDDVKIDVKNKNIFKVKTFSEKPDQEMAKKFIESGDFLWNSGIFVANLNTWLNTLKDNLPDVYSTFRSGIKKYNTPQESSFVRSVYTVCKNISIDYGIMEKADNTYVYVSSFGWNDLGTWDSLYNSLEKDKNGNSIKGKNVKVYDTENSIVKIPDNKLVVLQGLQDYIVAEDEDRLLICKRDQESMIRRFINDIKLDHGDKYL
ncbi:MAG: mannose-1-phosphate guanylyltransferase [Bacteroidales bacterium]|nr:mannose-1-phosphate guanylyltransferase [Bacteroidales bacterium]MCF8327134.1 mannose-1-phosphate guanylyltransferase [Bacteroidales bacterium]